MKTGIFIPFAITTIILYWHSYHNPPSANFHKKKTSILFECRNFGSNIYSLQEKNKYLFLGVEKCASVCHNNDTMGYQYNSWNRSPHSMAYKILDSKKAQKYAREAKIKEDPRESQTCLKCHITASGLDSSYLSATYRKDDGVTCEACHKHYYDGKTYLPKETDCLKCHKDSPHSINKFDFIEACAKIAHPRPKVNSSDSRKIKDE